MVHGFGNFMKGVQMDSLVCQELSGCARALVVSHCPVTLVARVQPTSVHVRLVDEWHWDTFFPQVLWFSAISIIPLVHHTHFSFIFKQYYVNYAIDSISKTPQYRYA
jgi:hypothetical protein